MKLFGALAAIAVLGVSAADAADLGQPYPAALAPIAAPNFSGSISLFGGLGDWSDCSSCDFDELGASGKFAYWFGPNFSAQVDGNFDSQSYDGGGSWNIGSIVGHLSYRQPNFLIGGLVGVADADWGERILLAGAETQVYIGPRATIEARYINYSSDGDDIDHFGAALRFFPRDNLKLELNASYNDFSWGDNGSSIGALAEYKFDHSPFAVFASADFGRSYGDGYTVVKGGLRILFNQDTLLSEDRTGASLGSNIHLPIRLAD